MSVYSITEADMRGLSIRLAMLQTHYRKPKDFSFEELNNCAKTLRRWLAACIPNDSPHVPLPVMLALCDDLNTPAAIAEMHRLSKADGRALFTAMKLLGLIPGHERVIDYDIGEVKTLPIDHIPLVRWQGFPTANNKEV
jgi:cysteinyl-tRNA synthetase